MKRLVVVLCSCLVLGGVGSQPIAASSGSSASEATKVRALLLYQVGLFNQARWRPLWQTYTQRVHSRCSYSRFVSEQSTLKAAFGRLAVRNVAVRVRGDRAFVLYQIVARGRLVGAATSRHPDVYARVGGRWFDDVDAGSPC